MHLPYHAPGVLVIYLADGSGGRLFSSVGESYWNCMRVHLRCVRVAWFASLFWLQTTCYWYFYCVWTVVFCFNSPLILIDVWYRDSPNWRVRCGAGPTSSRLFHYLSSSVYFTFQQSPSESRQRWHASLSRLTCFLSCVPSLSLTRPPAGGADQKDPGGAHRQGHDGRPADHLQRRGGPGARPRARRHHHRPRWARTRHVQVSAVWRTGGMNWNNVMILTELLSLHRHFAYNRCTMLVLLRGCSVHS